MKTATLLLLLSLAGWSGGVVAQPPSPADPDPRGNGALLKTAEAHLAAGRIEPGLASLREALAQAPGNHDARLRLAGVLMDRNRYAEALPELRRVLAARPDVAVHTAWLHALDAVGAPVERALAAEEAVRRHPGHYPFVWSATEALVAVEAPDLALSYWRRLPKTDQSTPRGQYLLGAIHEGSGRLVDALAAYRLGRNEPRAQAALARLQTRAVNLGGPLFYPPKNWVLQSGEPPRLTDLRFGVQVMPTWLARTNTQEALRKVIGQRLYLPADYPLEQMLSGKRKPAKDLVPPDPLSIEPFACPGQRPMVCVEVGPRKEFAGLLPRFQAGAIELRTGTLVVVLEGTEASKAAGLLRALADAPILVDGGQP